MLKTGRCRVGNHKKSAAPAVGRYRLKGYILWVFPSLTNDTGQLTIPFPVLLLLLLVTTLLLSLLLFALLTLAFLAYAVFFSTQVINTSFRDLFASRITGVKC